MIEPARIESPDEGNGGAEVARVMALFWFQDRLRALELDRLIEAKKIPSPTPERTLCRYGHPLDGTKTKRGKPYRYCRTCNRERMREAR